MSFAVPEDLKSEFERVAKEQDRSMSSLARSVLRNYLAEQKPPSTEEVQE